MAQAGLCRAASARHVRTLSALVLAWMGWMTLAESAGPGAGVGPSAGTG